MWSAVASRLLSRTFAPTARKFSTLLAPSKLARPAAILRPAVPMWTPMRTMASKKHKKTIKLAKGYRGRANRCFSVAVHRVRKARQYAYRDRKVKKRDMRKLWILRSNAASRMYGLPYSKLIFGMARSNIHLNRKIVSDLAVTEPLSFLSLTEVVKQTL